MMLEAIGEALKMRLCLTDLTFEKECEENDMDANQQFLELKEQNSSLYGRVAELNAAMQQVHQEPKLKHFTI